MAMNIKNLLAATALVVAVVAPTFGEAQVRHYGRTIIVRRHGARIYRPHRRVVIVRHHPMMRHHGRTIIVHH